MRYLRRIRPFAGLGAIFIIVGAGSVLSINHVKREVSQIVDDTLPGLMYAGKINSYISENFIRLLIIMRPESPEERARYRHEIEDTGNKIDDAVARYEGAIRSENDRQNLVTMLAKRKQCRIVRNQLIALTETGDRDEIQRFFTSQFLPSYTEYVKAAETVFHYNFEEGGQRGRRIIGVCNTATWLIAILSIGVFAVGAMTPVLVTRFGPPPAAKL